MYFRIFKWQKMENAYKLLERCFLLLKMDRGSIVSQMLSLFNKGVDNGTLELTC